MAGTVDGNLNKDMGEDEYLVAADLTLYANPLRILNRPKKKDPAQAPEQKKEKEEEPESSQQSKTGKDQEIIAADLTKYGSPLDDRKY